jgi:putative heme-binding domain-containing protein
MNLLGARPQHDTFGLGDAMLVAPGAPDRSVLVHRLARRGRGQMPPLVTNRVDEGAVRLFRDWIARLKPEQAFVRAWEVGDFLPALDRLTSGRSVEAGREAFHDTGCGQCHRFEGAGGSVGPDLAGVGRRLQPRDLLESILLPSKVIADGYADTVLETADGRVVSGRVEREDERAVVLRPPAAGEVVTVPKKDVVGRRQSDVSNMPAGTVNVLRKEQVLDRLAYLLGDAKPDKAEPR